MGKSSGMLTLRDQQIPTFRRIVMRSSESVSFQVHGLYMQESSATVCNGRMGCWYLFRVRCVEVKRFREMSSDSHMAVSERWRGLSDMRHNWYSCRPSRERVGQVHSLPTAEWELHAADRRPQIWDWRMQTKRLDWKRLKTVYCRLRFAHCWPIAHCWHIAHCW